jgi:tRNA pseudouridine32 synthase/23S rRNA pseudouridine746 synthase
LYTIIDESPEFVLMHKPCDIDCMSSDGTAGFFAQVQQQLSEELKPVHRLDKMTSGLLIFAKGSANAALFYELFTGHQIEKYYVALSDKKPAKKQGLIIGDMEKARRSQWRLTRSRQNPAKTRFFSHSVSVNDNVFLNDKVSFSGREDQDFSPRVLRSFLLRPYSGKTHQIRVALNSLGSPILGDPIYRGSEADRGYLHAYALKFELAGRAYQYQLRPEQGRFFCHPDYQSHLDSMPAPWDLNWGK